jgi:O-antigen biosynthesis protein WbqP
MKRLFDLVVAATMLALLSPILVLVALAVRLESRGPAIFWSKRIGRDSRFFAMPKFRTMQVGTPQLPTHLLTDGASHLTRIGGFLRRTSLDELPQLWSVLTGDMSLVGPRPALFNQDDLMALRRAKGLDGLRPGITGWAQINGRDELSIEEKVDWEEEYLARRSFAFDLRILLLTARQVLLGRGVAH